MVGVSPTLAAAGMMVASVQLNQAAFHLVMAVLVISTPDVPSSFSSEPPLPLNAVPIPASTRFRFQFYRFAAFDLDAFLVISILLPFWSTILMPCLFRSGDLVARGRFEAHDFVLSLK